MLKKLFINQTWESLAELWTKLNIVNIKNLYIYKWNKLNIIKI